MKKNRFKERLRICPLSAMRTKSEIRPQFSSTVAAPGITHCHCSAFLIKNQAAIFAHENRFTTPDREKRDKKQTQIMINPL